MQSSGKKKAYFKASWLNDYNWLAAVDNDLTKYACKWCGTVGKLGNMGVKPLKVHESGT